VAVLVVIAGCGDGGEGGTDGSGAAPASPPDGLLGTQWISTSVTDDGDDRPLEPGTAISLGFTEDQVAASAGCNSMSGSTSWEGDVLVVSRLGGTEMGCDPPLMRQDEWLVGVLSSRPVVEVNEAGMTLTSGGLVLSFADREVAMPDTELEGTTWILDGIGQGGGDDGSMSSVPGGVRSTLRIIDGNVGVKPGCNTGGGDVEVSDSTLSFGAIMTTLMACPGARDDVEKAVLSVLKGDVDYHIDGDVLTMTNGEQTLVYRAETG
jgi:heat shock protein HslJ